MDKESVIAMINDPDVYFAVHCLFVVKTNIMQILKK